MCSVLRYVEGNPTEVFKLKEQVNQTYTTFSHEFVDGHMQAVDITHENPIFSFWNIIAPTDFEAYKTDVVAGDLLENLKVSDKVHFAVFDSISHDVLRECKVKDWDVVESDEVEPRGSTPLYDSVGKIMAVAEEAKAKKTVLVVMTDGYENASKEHTQSSIKAKVKQFEDKGWEVLFLGANFDAVETVSGSVGVMAGKTMNIAAGSLRSSMDTLSSYSTLYAATGASINFTAEDKMKAVNAVIGGEGNGGIILPELHYGRDALIGIALFLTHLAHSNKTIKQLRNTYPDYFMSKNKITLSPSTDVNGIFKKIKEKYKGHQINTEDGLKIDFDNDWVHLRTSNTEPIIRIYAESNFETTSENIAKKMIQDIHELM